MSIADSQTLILLFTHQGEIQGRGCKESSAIRLSI